MALKGKQKAAVLLSLLDSNSATALLKGLEPQLIQELAMEMASLDSSGKQDQTQEFEVAKEFCDTLEKGQGGRLNINSFLNDMLVSILGKEQAKQIQQHIKQISQKKDPFIEIRSANIDELVLALEGQHPQTTALVLSELSATQSQMVISHLSEQDRSQAVRKLPTLDTLGPEVRRQIASMVSERLKEFKGETLPEEREQTLRKLAKMIGGLENELRDKMLEEIAKDDKETADMVRNLMITWNDIVSIADRSLQEVLRNVDSGKLAIALYGAEEKILEKVRSNISERAAESLDEESSLMQDPLDNEVEEAREEILKPLREANEAGTLRFVKRK